MIVSSVLPFDARSGGDDTELFPSAGQTRPVFLSPLSSGAGDFM